MNQRGQYIYDYPRPMVTVDAVVFTLCENRLHVLLIRRGKPPFQGRWALPGGFIGMDEPLCTSVVRELGEETGLREVYLEQFHAFGDPGRDPRGRTVTVAYVGLAGKPTQLVEGADDASAAAWLDLTSLPDLAFDHNRIVSSALRYLCLKTKLGSAGDLLQDLDPDEQRELVKLLPC